MNDTRTSSMLQRLPVILAVTAASYGLQLPAHAGRPVAPAKAHTKKTSQPFAASIRHTLPAIR